MLLFPNLILNHSPLLLTPINFAKLVSINTYPPLFLLLINPSTQSTLLIYKLKINSISQFMILILYKPNSSLNIFSTILIFNNSYIKNSIVKNLLIFNLNRPNKLNKQIPNKKLVKERYKKNKK
jgi:hypothetical protein